MEEREPAIAGGFGIRTPPLLEYLQGILRGYSDGQILKELLQNAEDAGASEIRFLYDGNHYLTESLLEECLADFQGPALCSYNNAVFEDRDWKGIQEPSQSCKKNDVLKVGRFGIGFNSVYHLTDLPCIISQSVLAVIDPFERYFYFGRKPSSGNSWDLRCEFEDAKDQLKPVIEAFPEDIKFEKEGYFPGTFFRFPLRKEPNKLSQSVFSSEKIRDLFDAFTEDARIVLLFLRKVEKAAVYWKEEFSQTSECFLEISFPSSCIEKLRQDRQTFTNALQNVKDNPDDSDNIEITNTFDIVTKCTDLETKQASESMEQWVVSQEIAIDCSPELATLYQKLKFLPWMGVAIPLFNLKETLKGRTFCFLPLPQGDDSLSGLPVHVHGFFGVSDDRRSLKWPGGDQIQNDTAEWNKLLVNEVLPRVYRKALLKAIDITLEQNDTDPNIVYKAMPNISQELNHWKEAVEKFFSKLFQDKVLYCHAQKAWMSVNEVIIMTSDLPAKSERARVIVKCLQNSGLHVVKDLPQHVRDAIERFAPESRYCSPSLVIECLKKQPIGDYSNADRLYILDYLLEKLPEPEDTNGLELLPTCAGNFTSFKAHPTTNDVVYVETNTCSQKLLSGVRKRFVKHLEEEHLSKLNQALEKMASSETWKQLKQLDVDAVIQLLPESLPKSWIQEAEDYVDWNPSTGDQPPLQWLQQFWNFVCREDIDLSKLEGLKILPVSGITREPIRMMSLEKNSRIIHVGNDEQKITSFAEIKDVLTKVGVTVCELPNFVTKYNEIWNSSYVHSFHQDDVVKALKATGARIIEHACSSNKDIQCKITSHLLPYLSGASLTSHDISFLRGLCVFRTFQNNQTEAENLLSIDSGISVLKMEDLQRLPQIPLHEKYILVGTCELLLFLEKLNVKPQPFDDVLRRLLVDAANSLYPGEEIQVLFEWVRLHFDEINCINGVEDLVKEISLVPNGHKKLRKPKNLYDSSNEYVKYLVHDKEVLLSENVSSNWLEILNKLGLQEEKNITTDHLLNAAKTICSQNNVKQASVLVEYLCKYPHRLQDIKLRTDLTHFQFISCKFTPPSFYPSELSFCGKEGVLYKPADLLVYSEKTCYLAGASTPMVDSVSDQKVLEQLSVKSEPKVGEVLQQLKQCVQLNNTSSLTEMMQHIYKFLNENIKENKTEILNSLPEEWILVDDQFVSVKSVYKEEGEGAIDLRPFLCILPRKYKEYDDLLKAAGVPEKVDSSASFLVDVLEKIKASVDTNENMKSSDMGACLRVSTNILRRLVEFEDEIEHEDIKCKLFVPTNTIPMKLLPPDQVCFDDRYDKDEGDDFEVDEDEPPIYLVHSDVSLHIIKKLGVTSLTKRLAGADEIGDIIQTGQYEPITVRLKNILRNGYQPESIPKEMVQNAEDAGASEVKFLLDLRSNENAVKRLLDPAMEAIHGPALWVYNDATFTNEDLQNITKLGGATKSEDRSKIGQFGLGFNAVYHITDVPSFVTGDFITFFDPHKTHLQRHIRSERSGIQLNFTLNPPRMRRFRDQFLPYEDIFGCKILGDDGGPRTYKSTLFRLPLRTEAEAMKSEIWNESYNEERMKLLLKSICRNACKMLLFTESVTSISVYLLNEGEGCVPSMLYESFKSTTQDGPVIDSFRKAVHSSVTELDESSIPVDTTSVVLFESKWSEKGKQYLQPNDVELESYEKWIVTMSAGRGRIFHMCQEEKGLKSGLLPCGAVAWSPSSNTGGNVFCFLPLSVPQSGLPVCINGSLAVSSDRRSLLRESGTTNQEPVFETRWNQSLFEDVIVSAYITLLQHPIVQKQGNTDEDAFILWPNPLETSKNSDFGAVMTGFYKSVVFGINERPSKSPPKVFLKKDRTYSIKDILFTVDTIQNDNQMFPIVERVVKRITSKEIMKIPTWVRKGFEDAGCSSTILKMTYSWERFFKEIFLPNIVHLQNEDISDLLLNALSVHDGAVLDLMRISDCVPTKTSHGRLYKKPSSLFDPFLFKDIFSNDDEVFPDDKFLKVLDKRQEGSLKEIGCLKDDLSWDDILERSKTVQNVWRMDELEARRRIGALLNFMHRKLQADESVECSQNVKNDLRQVVFLPAMRDNDVDLQCPSNIYLAEERNLVGYVCYILDTSNAEVSPSQSVCSFLGMQGKKVKTVDAMENFRRLKQMHADGLRPNTLQRKCESMYHYLQEHLGEEDVLHFLQNETFFCFEEEFIETNSLACFSDPFPPYLFRIPDNLSNKFHPLFKAAGVKDSFEFNDYIRTLNLIKINQNGEPLDQDKISNILTKVIEPLFRMVDEIPTELIPHILLPDSNNMLQPSGSLSYCDLDSFKDLTSKYMLCHKEISSLHAKKLGVRDIRDQMLKEYSHNLPACTGIGESFGQREDLVTRIKRIMEGYPCDFSILKELVQNADDAEATKVHFVLDEREHPSDRLFYDSMSQLQGPALLVYNDKPFTDDDIKGIQNLGEGSRSDETDKTGRYGVGFNVVYHLTDCPMFLSGEDTFCIFDPTLQYVSDADELSPGRMFRPINEKMFDSYFDLFNCFFSFRNYFNFREGTFFRFPLRQAKSKISKAISPSDIKELFAKFKDEMFDILLFLKNVTEISFSTCTNGTLGTTYTVTANLSQEERNDRDNFFKELAKQKESTVLDFPVSDLTYQTTITDNDGRVDHWIIHQRLGIANEDAIPESVNHANTVTKLKLLPKGGVAAKLMCKKSGKNVSSKTHGKAFCFLPLPILTNLPVHVDGYFSLGHEARRNLWEAPAGDARGDWNRLIVKEIIAPVYVLILEKITKILTDDVEKGLKLLDIKEKLHHYHSLFPLDFKAGNGTTLNAWDELGQEFYHKVTRGKFELFPVVRPECLQDSPSQANPGREDVHLSWKSCVLNADKVGYFDDLRRQIRQHDIERQSTERRMEKQIPKFLQLKHLLLNLEFPLLETPIKIYDTMKKVFSRMGSDAPIVLKISPEVTENWLKTVAKETALQGLPMQLEETRVNSIEHLHLLSNYVTKAAELKLSGLPLLLTNDGILREFSTNKKVFHSHCYNLLPECAEEFLYSPFLGIFNKEDECFAVLKLSDLVERLVTHLPKDQFCTGQYVQWHQDTRNKDHTPKVDWVKKLWQFLFENKGKPEWEANVVETFGNWSILPVHEEKEDVKHLVPMILAKTVLSDKVSDYHNEMETILKCLHCPIVDTTTLKGMGISDFVTTFVSTLDNAEHILVVFERLVAHKMERFQTLKEEDLKCILGYFCNQVNRFYGSDRNLMILKSLPCFETIHGDFVALTGKKIYAVAKEDIPKCDQHVWLSQSGCVFLKHFSHLTEFFKILEVEDLSEVDLFKQFILPCFKKFSTAAQWKHVTRIMDLIQTKNREPEIISWTFDLKNVPLVPQENGNPRLASSFYDDENPVFREMLEEGFFPPKHPNEEYNILWPQFLRDIGIQTNVSYGQFEDFATKLSKEPKNSKREKILLAYFFESHHLHGDSNFLTRLATIPFISAADTPQDLQDLHEPCISGKVTFSSVPEEHQKLVWSKAAVLPKWVHKQTCQKCGIFGNLNTYLLKTKEPSLSQVLLHTQTLCCSLAKFEVSSHCANEPHPVLKYGKLLGQVMREIYAFLSEKCEKAQTCETCSNKTSCCTICEQIVKTLEDIPLVPLKSGEFFKAKSVAIHLPKTENENLFMFLRELPTTFAQYCNLFYCLGATKEPSLFQYASILKVLKGHSYGDLYKNPNIFRAAKQAVEGFFRCLAKAEKIHLDNIDELILPTNSMEAPFLPSTQVFYNDEPAYVSRLEHFQYPLMRPVNESALHSEDDLNRLVEKLGHLKPQLISLNVEEIQTAPVEEPQHKTHKCSLSKRLANVFSWHTFVPALKIILANDKVNEDVNKTLDEISEIHFNVRCLGKITTELRMKDGAVIPHSEADAGVLFKRTEADKVDVFISHSAKEALLYYQIAEGFNNFFGNFVKSTHFLEIVFRSNSKKEVITNLSRRGLRTKHDELEDLIKSPVLGSEIEEDIICLLVQHPFCHFSPTEYVGYNDAHSECEHLVYAKIIRKVNNVTDISIEQEYLKAKYILEVGRKTQIEADAIWLYKFMPTDDITHLYNPNRSPSSSTYIAIFEEQSSRQESSDSSDDYNDLDKTKREITKIIEDLWEQEESFRNTALKRMMRNWHPDKHKEEHKNFASEVFKHIRTEIDRMEKGNPSGIDTDEDIFRWAQQNTAEQRQYWQFHRKGHGTRNRRGRKGRGRGWHTGFTTPPSFHKINFDACRWLEQARADIKAAGQFDENDKDFFQWKSCLCFFAAEKSVIAAQLVCGCEIITNQNIMEAAVKLNRHLNVTSAVQQLVKIVEKDSHYPSSCPGTSIPRDIFTKEQADEAMQIARNIITEVHNYIQNE